MHGPSAPFPLPDKLERELARVHSYWQGLRRAENSMPFWDDLKLSALSDSSGAVLLIDVFSDPERFRFNYLADELKQRYGETLAGKFADEIELRDPFTYLRAQCSATVEGRIPTYYRQDANGGSPDYSRILLPMWGNGSISMLLGAIAER
jgi:hypothetical protein